jgi:hypothetical protein
MVSFSYKSIIMIKEACQTFRGHYLIKGECH